MGPARKQAGPTFATDDGKNAPQALRILRRSNYGRDDGKNPAEQVRIVADRLEWLGSERSES
jgi:hypothetical protein